MGYDFFRNITIQQLEILIEVIEAGSFTRAASQLLLSQPTLTKHIQNLEAMIGSRVIARSNAGVSLTSEGRVLYDYARRICRIREEARDKLQKMKSLETDEIIICASNIPSTYILPQVIAGFSSLRPDTHVRVQVGDSHEAQAMVLSDEAEIGFIGKEIHEKKLHTEPIWKDELVLAAPGEGSFFKPGRVALPDVMNAPFIVRERGSGTRDALEKYLQKTFAATLLDFRTVLEMGSSEAIKEAVMAGVGVSIISNLAIRRETRMGLLTVVPIDLFFLERNFYLIYKKKFKLTACQQDFLNYVRKRWHNGHQVLQHK